MPRAYSYDTTNLITTVVAFAFFCFTVAQQYTFVSQVEMQVTFFSPACNASLLVSIAKILI